MTNPAFAQFDAVVEPAELDDAELLVRVARRAPDAFRVLYERHRDAVTRYAFHCAGTAAEAEDIVAAGRRAARHA